MIILLPYILFEKYVYILALCQLYRHTFVLCKARPQMRGHNSAKSQPIFEFFFTGRFPGKFAVNVLLKIQPHLAYVATLPCETLMSENKRLTINYKVV